MFQRLRIIDGNWREHTGCEAFETASLDKIILAGDLKMLVLCVWCGNHRLERCPFRG